MGFLMYTAGLVDGHFSGAMRDDAPDPLGPATRLVLALHPEGDMLARAIRVVELSDTLRALKAAEERGYRRAAVNADTKARALRLIMYPQDVAMAERKAAEAP